MTLVSQSQFRAALTDPRLPAPDGLTDPDGRPAGARFDVYRNNVVVSLSKALAEAFPALEALLGPQNFGVLAREFVRTHAPSSPLMAQYGAEMPAFLQSFPHTKTMGYLPDVARLEQALRQSYHAADAAPADLSALATLTPEDIAATRVSLSPATIVLQSQWPALQVWHFARGTGPKPTMTAEDIVILRPEFDPAPHLLPQGGAAAIIALQNGATLGEAAAQAAEVTPDFDLSPTLSLLIAGNAITALHTP